MYNEPANLDNLNGAHEEEVQLSANMPLHEYIDIWLRTFKEHSVKQSTYDRLLTSRKTLDEYTIKDMPVCDITSYHIQRYVNQLASHGYSPSTIKKQMRIVTAPLKQAAALHLIPCDPVVGIRIPVSSEEPNDISKTYGPDEQARIEKAASETDTEGAAVVRLLLETGLRAGEILALRWHDVDIFKKRLYVRATVVRLANKKQSRIQNSPKTASSRRIVPLTPKAIMIFERQKQKSKHGEFVFADKDGFNLSYEALRYQVQKLCEKAGVPYLGIHAFRHTFATNCYHKGMDAKILSKLLGHSDVSVTLNVYCHLYDDGFDELYDALNR